jgi:hypothetical protein
MRLTPPSHLVRAFMDSDLVRDIIYDVEGQGGIFSIMGKVATVLLLAAGISWAGSSCRSSPALAAVTSDGQRMTFTLQAKKSHFGDWCAALGYFEQEAPQLVICTNQNRLCSQRERDRAGPEGFIVPAPAGCRAFLDARDEKGQDRLTRYLAEGLRNYGRQRIRHHNATQHDDSDGVSR